MAKEGCNLVLTARSEDKLNELKSELQRQYNISVEIIAIDLSLKLSRKSLNLAIILIS